MVLFCCVRLLKLDLPLKVVLEESALGILGLSLLPSSSNLATSILSSAVTSMLSSSFSLLSSITNLCSLHLLNILLELRILPSLFCAPLDLCQMTTASCTWRVVADRWYLSTFIPNSGLSAPCPWCSI